MVGTIQVNCIWVMQIKDQIQDDNFFSYLYIIYRMFVGCEWKTMIVTYSNTVLYYTTEVFIKYISSFPQHEFYIFVLGSPTIKAN